MDKSKTRFPAKDVIARSYKATDEAQIVNLLNICFGDWGTLQKWEFLYSKYPTFKNDDIVILEVDGQVIGHGGIHFRDLMVEKHRLYTATLSDAAIHPRHRGRGLYTKLVNARLKAAKSKGTCLAIAWHLRGSNAYEHNRKTGFVEIKQSPVYMKIIRPEKVLATGLYDLLHKNQRLRWALEDLQDDLCFHVGKAKFRISELLGEKSESRKKGQAKVQIFFDASALLTMANFRNMGKFEKIGNLVSLIFLRRIKVKFVSLRGLLSLASKGAKIVGAV